MSPNERAKLVAAWIEHSTREVVRDEQNVFRERKGQDHFWAFEQLDDICRTQPELCWELMLQILHTPHHESVDAALAAGPLEDLIARHGAGFIAKVEQQAGTDAKFKHLLGGVWQNSTPKDLWARVEAVRGEVW
jgi:hypothetical protein